MREYKVANLFDKSWPKWRMNSSNKERSELKQRMRFGHVGEKGLYIAQPLAPVGATSRFYRRPLEPVGATNRRGPGANGNLPPHL